MLFRSYGPQLQFSLTWLVEPPDGKQYAQSTPGFRYVKRTGGTYWIIPPAAKKNSYATFYSCVLSTDLLEIIEKALVDDGWQEKVGSNNDHKELAGWAETLAAEMREEKETSEFFGPDTTN